MSIATEQFKKMQLKADVSDVKAGDTVKVHQKIKEKNKERIQIFEGVVIAKKHGKGVNATITVRKVVQGVGVERIFPLHAPFIAKIEIVSSGKVRRSKLYYLRHAKGKKARLKRRERAFAAAIAQEPEPEPEAEAEARQEAPDQVQASTPVESQAPEPKASEESKKQEA